MFVFPPPSLPQRTCKVPRFIRATPKLVLGPKPTISTSERQENSWGPSSADLSFSCPQISLADFSAGIDFKPNVADMALGISNTAGLFQALVRCAPSRTELMRSAEPRSSRESPDERRRRVGFGKLAGFCYQPAARSSVIQMSESFIHWPPHSNYTGDHLSNNL